MISLSDELHRQPNTARDAASIQSFAGTGGSGSGAGAGAATGTAGAVGSGEGVAGSTMGEAALEGSGEEPCLSVEAGVGGVIPDEVVGLGDFRREVELRGDDVFGNFVGELALFAEPGPLCGGRTGDDDHRGKVALGVGLVEQGNIGAEPVIAARRFPGHPHPAVADDGVENLLKLTPLVGIGKDNFTQACPVGASLLPDGVSAKRGNDCFLHTGIVREQVMRAAIGIKNIRRQIAEQGLGETGFPRSHAPGNA